MLEPVSFTYSLASEAVSFADSLTSVIERHNINNGTQINRVKYLLPRPLSVALEAASLADSTPFDATFFTFSFASANMIQQSIMISI
jgi:hypothetical protein